MDCSEVREHLSDLNRGRLEADTAQVVRAHVAQCPTCAAALQAEARIHALIRGQAPRYSAPPALKTRVQALLAESASPEESVARGAAAGTRRTAGRSRWRDLFRGHAWTIGSLAGAVAVLLVVWAGWLWLARDPVSLLAEGAVTEHLEYVKDAMTRPAADPSAVMGKLKSQVDFAFEPVFPGDAQVQLVSGKVEKLRGKRTAMFIYRDGSGRYTTLFLMPEAGIVIPDEGRLPIETFKPYHRMTKGRQLLLWKQRNLACLLVSDLDQAGMASMFLKVRKTT
ncbi:MAG: anti-sigma factor family protein [Candidatus Methylomirabilales bacterium]